MSTRWAFPETLRGQHGITSPKPITATDAEEPAQSQGQDQKVKKCMFVIQEYECLHHPNLNVPHLLHRTPCPQALLARSQQNNCQNFVRREGEMVKVARYQKERGCMECKSLARTRRRQEKAKHADIIKKMNELGLKQDSIEDFEKVVGSSPASRRVVDLVKAKMKKKSEKERARKQQIKIKQQNDEQMARLTRFAKEFGVASYADIADSNHPLAPVSLLQDSPSVFELGAAIENLHITAAKRPSTPIVSAPEAPATEVDSDIEEGGVKITEPEPETVEPEAAFYNAQEEISDEDFDYSIDPDEEWDWGKESERMWGEVALAPGDTCNNKDMWVVIGSWEQID